MEKECFPVGVESYHIYLTSGAYSDKSVIAVGEVRGRLARMKRGVSKQQYSWGYSNDDGLLTRLDGKGTRKTNGSAGCAGMLECQGRTVETPMLRTVG